MPQLLKAKTKPLTPRLVTGQELVLQWVTATTAPRVLQLGATVPHQDYQPTQALARCLHTALRDEPQAIARYECPPGHEPLRRIVAARMALAECEVNSEQITITNGCQEAVTTCLSLVAKRGDVIAVESPAYFGMLQAIQLAGMKALEINTDPEQGIDLDALQNALGKWPVTACVLSANASNPLGCTMSDDAKHSLVKMLSRHRVALIEDDAYGDLAFSQQRPKACFSYQQKHPVYYCSSFSKTICPGLRVGWIVSPRGDQRARLSKFLSNIATATVEQIALASYLRSGAYDRHLRDRRTQYAGNAAGLLRDIRAHFPLGTRTSRPQGAITIWVELPAAADTLELAQVCLQHDVRKRHMPDREYARHALLGIATPQSNPVVEAEMSALLPDGVGMLVTRLTGVADDARGRFYEYMDNLETSLQAYGKARIDAFGFSFTATAYMADVNQDERLAAMSQKMDYPIISSAQAIERALQRLGAKRLALFSPYPDWLTELSSAYWTAKGYEVVSVATMAEDTSDTVKIYALRTEGMLEASKALDTKNADAIVVTGSGMATLRAVAPLSARTGKPFLCSNICLAWALLDELGLAHLAPPRHPGEVLIGEWTPRLSRL